MTVSDREGGTKNSSNVCWLPLGAWHFPGLGRQCWQDIRVLALLEPRLLNSGIRGCHLLKQKPWRQEQLWGWMGLVLDGAFQLELGVLSGRMGRTTQEGGLHAGRLSLSITSFSLFASTEHKCTSWEGDTVYLCPNRCDTRQSSLVLFCRWGDTDGHYWVQG